MLCWTIHFIRSKHTARSVYHDSRQGLIFFQVGRKGLNRAKFQLGVPKVLHINYLALLEGAEEETEQLRTLLSELIVTLILGDRAK